MMKKFFYCLIIRVVSYINDKNKYFKMSYSSNRTTPSERRRVKDSKKNMKTNSIPSSISIKRDEKQDTNNGSNKENRTEIQMKDETTIQTKNDSDSKQNSNENQNLENNQTRKSIIVDLEDEVIKFDKSSASQSKHHDKIFSQKISTKVKEDKENIIDRPKKQDVDILSDINFQYGPKKATNSLNVNARLEEAYYLSSFQPKNTSTVNKSPLLHKDTMITNNQFKKNSKIEKTGKEVFLHNFPQEKNDSSDLQRMDIYTQIRKYIERNTSPSQTKSSSKENNSQDDSYISENYRNKNLGKQKSTIDLCETLNTKSRQFLFSTTNHNTKKICSSENKNALQHTSIEKITNSDLCDDRAKMAVENLKMHGECDEIAFILSSLYGCSKFKTSSKGLFAFYDFDAGFWSTTKSNRVILFQIREEARKLFSMNFKNDLETKKDKDQIILNIDKATSIPRMKKRLNYYKMNFVQDSFFEDLNNLKKTIPFRNGVLNLENCKIVPKTPHSNTFTFTLDFDYRETAHSTVLDQFLQEIQPNENDRHFLLFSLARCLDMATDNSIVTWFVGNSANGKTTLIDLFWSCLQEFCTIKDLTIFKDFEINKQSEVLMNELKHKRACFVMDDGYSSLNELGLLKITGNLPLVHKSSIKYNGHERNLKTKFFICSKIIPNISPESLLMKNIRILYFPTEFVENTQNQTQFKKDLNMKEKLETKEVKQAFFSKLLKYYTKYHSVHQTIFNDMGYQINNKISNMSFTSFLKSCCTVKDGYVTTNEALFYSFRRMSTAFKEINLLKRDHVKKYVDIFIRRSVETGRSEYSKVYFTNTRFFDSKIFDIDKESCPWSDIVSLTRNSKENKSKTRRFWMNLKIENNVDEERSSDQ